jgi:hypothetical protein
VGTWGGSSVPAATSCGRVVQLVGSVIEKPHGLHCHTYRFWATTRLISCSKVIGLPQTGQTTSAVGAAGSIIPCLFDAIPSSVNEEDQQLCPRPDWYS